MKTEKKNTADGRNWILKNGRGQYRKVVVLSLFCMVNSGLGVWLALALKEVVDGAVSGNENAFWRAVILAVFMVFVQIAFGCGIRYLDERSRADLENTMKHNVWMKIMTRDYGSLESFHTGELMNRISSDAKLVSDNIVTLIPSLVSMLTRLISAMIILFFLDWRFAFIFFIGGIAVIGVTGLFRGKVKKLHKQMQAAEGEVRSFQQEMLESMIVVRSFQAEEKVSELSRERMVQHKKTRMKKNLFSNITQTGFSSVMNIGYLFGIIWCGMGILEHRISYGTLLAVQQLVGQVQQPIAGMTNIIPRYYAMIASAERLIEIETLPADGGETTDTAADWSVDKTEIRKIEIQGISVGYQRDGESVLENADMEIDMGDLIAVTGESGVGKSTLLKMLLCLYPLSEGRIQIKEENQSYDLNKQMRSLFAYVPQGNFLMSGTIRDVVSMYGMPGCMSVEEACRIACAGDYIEELKDAYDTRLGERGVGLSEGQMQRLAIARALYMGAPILLLDEATSALDGNTEVQVLENIRKLTEKTVIIVTHRPAALAICNRRVEIRDKKIWEG